MKNLAYMIGRLRWQCMGVIVRLKDSMKMRQAGRVEAESYIFEF